MSIFAAALLTWLGIAFCLSQSALFSGLNLAVFSTSCCGLSPHFVWWNRSDNEMTIK